MTDTIGPAIIDRMLVVEGGSVNDSVTLSVEPGNMLRLVYSLGGGTGANYRVSLSSIDVLQIFGGNGNDTIFVSQNVLLPTFIDGGPGNDFIRGTNFSNLILGGPGNDQIHGGNARDVLIGGEGSDTVYGYGEDDLMIGVNVNNTRDELISIRAAWLANQTFAARSATVRPMAKLVAALGSDVLIGSTGNNLILTPPPVGAGAAMDDGAGEPSALAAGESPAAVPSNPWLAPAARADIHPLIATNPFDPLDINGDGQRTPLDALAAINDMNNYGVRPLFVFSGDADEPGVCNFAAMLAAGFGPAMCRVRGPDNLFLDASLDDILSPLDSLLVINALNAAAASAETEQGEAEGNVELTARLPMFAAEGRPASADSLPPAAPGRTVEIATPSDRISRMNAIVAMIAKQEQRLRDVVATSVTETDWNADLLDLLARDIGRPSPRF